MTDKSIEEIIEEILKMELKVSERFDVVEDNYNQHEIEQACGSVMNKILDGVTDPRMEQKVWLLYGQIGQQIGSEDMVKMVMSKVNKEEGDE